VKINDDTLREAAELILRGELVAYPTDTVYGLGCDPFNDDAVLRLFNAKERVTGALPVLVEGFDIALKIGRFDKVAVALARKFWPGPLTIVVPAAARLPSEVTGSTNTVGLRAPAHQGALKLIHQSGGVLVGTSANITGKPSPTTAQEVARELGDRIDLILDGGQASPGVESTVVKAELGHVSILREKAIRRDQILAALESS
jgi:L-threonylcarbamoyladenylate synthase